APDHTAFVRPETRHAPPRGHRHHRGNRLPGPGGVRRNRADFGGFLRRAGIRAHPFRDDGSHPPAFRSGARYRRGAGRIPRRYPAGLGPAAGVRQSPAGTGDRAMMRALKKLGRLLVQNFWWKMLSLAIAALLWAVVWSEPELSTLQVVP